MTRLHGSWYYVLYQDRPNGVEGVAVHTFRELHWYAIYK